MLKSSFLLHFLESQAWRTLSIFFFRFKQGVLLFLCTMMMSMTSMSKLSCLRNKNLSNMWTAKESQRVVRAKKHVSSSKACQELVKPVSGERAQEHTSLIYQNGVLAQRKCCSFVSAVSSLSIQHNLNHIWLWWKQ